MFGIGMPELIVILVVALIVLGPDKLPEIAKSLGKGLSAFKKAADEIKGDIIEAAEETRSGPKKTETAESEPKEVRLKPDERAEKDKGQGPESSSHGESV